MNYYAVKKGKKIGVYNTWDECKEQVMGYSGAVYKKFTNLDDANYFISGDGVFEENAEKEKCEEDELIAYVDGSYDDSNKTFSFGAVIFDGVNIYETHSKRFYNEDATMRNVSGEIEGAMYAMKRAVELGKKVLYLHYDYAGIENWALKSWKANKEGTIKYRDFFEKISKDLKVVFIKVKAHSGVVYNELVDKLAKEAK